MRRIVEEPESFRRDEKVAAFLDLSAIVIFRGLAAENPAKMLAEYSQIE
jgi:hypothetical protein